MADAHPGTVACGFRFAGLEDCELLAALNAQLIRDEGHRNAMTPEQLAARMSDWLGSRDYQAVLFDSAAATCGYALFRSQPDHVYLRQFFVLPQFRRRGIGRQAIQWLWQNAWPDAARLRIDVLVGNTTARSFWKAVGFQEYCITMEAERTLFPGE